MKQKPPIVIIARRNISYGVVALTVRERIAILGACTAIMNPYVRHRIRKRINHLPAHRKRGRRSNSHHQLRARHAAFHVRHFATHHVVTVSREGPRENRRVRPERVIAEAPIIRQHVAVGVRRRSSKRHTVPTCHHEVVRRKIQRWRNVVRKQSLMHHHVDPFMAVLAPAPDRRHVNARFDIAKGPAHHYRTVRPSLDCSRCRVEQLCRSDRSRIRIVMHLDAVCRPPIVPEQLAMRELIGPLEILSHPQCVGPALDQIGRVIGPHAVG